MIPVKEQFHKIDKHETVCLEKIQSAFIPNAAVGQFGHDRMIQKT